MYHKRQFASKSIQVVIGKTRPILPKNSWFGCDGNLLSSGIKTPGVQLPIRKEVYQPILKELEEYGVVFKEQSMTYYGYKPDNTK
jgi:hypothetical protein